MALTPKEPLPAQEKGPTRRGDRPDETTQLIPFQVATALDQGHLYAPEPVACWCPPTRGSGSIYLSTSGSLLMSAIAPLRMGAHLIFNRAKKLMTAKHDPSDNLSRGWSGGGLDEQERDERGEPQDPGNGVPPALREGDFGGARNSDGLRPAKPAAK